MIKKTINDEIKKIIDENINNNFQELKNVDYLLEKPKTINLGNYSTNIALVSAKIHKMKPFDFATNFVSKIKSPLIERCEIAGPGFINIFLSDSYYNNLIKQILTQKENYGQFENKNINYHIEYVSANPTGSLHIGHARNAAFGSTLANIWEKYGLNVDREYYINDGGAQINKLGVSVLIRYLNLFGIDKKLPEDAYHGEEPIWVAKALKKEYNDKFINTQYDDNKILNKNEREIINTFSKTFLLELIKNTLSIFKTKMDIYYPESNIYKDNLIKPTLLKLKKDLYVKDNALWLKTTKYGDDKDRVLIKSDNTLTYFAPDIAYHNIKLNRKKYEKAFDILGADHAGYKDRLKAAINSLGLKDVLEIIIMQMVRLVKNGEEFKMSKRSGNSLTLNDLIETIGVDCARWSLVSQSINSHLEIDVDKVKNKDNSNAYYYVQYACARISQILKSQNIKPNIKIDTSLLKKEKERELLNLLSTYPKIIENIALNYEVHKLTTYLYNLSSLFHSYYSDTKILTNDSDMTNQRLMLINSILNVLKSGLNIIGIDAKQKI